MDLSLFLSLDLGGYLEVEVFNDLMA